MRVFHLATDLGPTAHGARLARLAPALKPRGVEQMIGVLGNCIPFESTIKDAGLAMTSMPLRRVVDLPGWRAIRAAIQAFQPQVVHCWGRRAAEAVNIARLPGVDGSTIWKAMATFEGSDTALSRRIDRRLILPPIAGREPVMDRRTARELLGFAESDRIILCADRCESPGAVKLAGWGMELLKYTLPGWRLLILGDGPARANLERSVAKLAHELNPTRFIGIVPDLAPYLAVADCIWQTRPRGGVHFTLDGLTAGLPVIAAVNPDLAGMLDETNSLPGPDAASIAAATLQLFDDESLRNSLASRARQTAARFGVEPAMEIALRAYSEF